MGVGLHNLCTEHRNLVPTNWPIKKLAHHPILAKFRLQSPFRSKYRFFIGLFKKNIGFYRFISHKIIGFYRFSCENNVHSMRKFIFFLSTLFHGLYRIVHTSGYTVYYIYSAKNAYFLYRSCPSSFTGWSAYGYTCSIYGLSNSYRQQDELLAVTEPCSTRGGLECLNWTNYLLHLLNSSHKFSYGGEYILFIEKNSFHIIWPNIRQGWKFFKGLCNW